jgi:taurine dioxygenase
VPIVIKPMQGAGAVISGVELTQLTAADAQQIKQALGEYGVVFFRDQSLTSEHHIELAEKFGRININRFFASLPDYPQIAQVLKEASQSANIGEQWHTDHSYDQIPALGSILVAREVPLSGGDTLFASMFAAYDALPDDMKDKLKGLTATHSSRHAFGAAAYNKKSEEDFIGRLGNPDAATQDAIHPVVIKHPFSGKQALYVNPDFTTHINGMEKAEGEALLNQLYEHASQEQFQCRFSWQDGTVAFWDNRATWHRALNDYPGQRRMMHRITIEGEALHA